MINNHDPLQLAADDDDVTLQTLISSDPSAASASSLWYSRQKSLLLRTPLTIAATYASLRSLRLLLSLSSAAAVNSPIGADLTTPLHCAASSASLSAPTAIRLLLSAGADPSLPNAAGHLPSDSILVSPATSHLRPLLLQLLTAATTEPETYYVTDEFRMFSFKIRACSRNYSHDWTECPFAHPGENARRRDPRKHQYSCVPCPEFRKGGAASCRRGESCQYSHGVFECWLHPAQYRTRLCKDALRCERRVCFFAHTPAELRPCFHFSPRPLPLSPRFDCFGQRVSSWYSNWDVEKESLEEPDVSWVHSLVNPSAEYEQVGDEVVGAWLEQMQVA